jgi:hypothetical protein
VPNCTKPQPNNAQSSTEPLVTACDSLLRLGLDVVHRGRKRPTMPALPNARKAAGRNNLAKTGCDCGVHSRARPEKNPQQ